MQVSRPKVDGKQKIPLEIVVSIRPATCMRDYSTTGDWLKFKSVGWLEKFQKI